VSICSFDPQAAKSISLDGCNADCYGGSKSLADQISASGDIRVHCMLASDWPSVRKGTDKESIRGNGIDAYPACSEVANGDSL